MRPHRKNSRNDKNTKKLSWGLAACQFYICHKDSKFSMLHKPIRKKKEIHSAKLPEYEKYYLPVVRMNRQPQIQKIFDLNFTWEFSKNSFTIGSKMKSSVHVHLYSDTAATFDENLYKSSSRGKTYKKRATYTESQADTSSPYSTSSCTDLQELLTKPT